MKNINVMSIPELQDLLFIMETKEAADEALPSEVMWAILNGLWAMQKQRHLKYSTRSDDVVHGHMAILPVEGSA
jgi:hypothetical protein